MVEAKCLTMRVITWVVACALACVPACTCGDRAADHERARHAASIGIAIEEALAKQLGVVVRVPCSTLPPACVAILPDQRELPIRIAYEGGAWTWQVEGLLVVADPIERYLRETLADLQVSQDVACAPRIRAIAEGERIQCTLQRGGRAFVTVRRDGTFAVELALDPTAAMARSDDEPRHERELDEQSRALVDGGVEDGEGEGEGDGDDRE